MVECKTQNVRKRDGRLAVFDFMKISDAVYRALIAVGKEENAREIADDLAKKIVELVGQRYRVPHVEEIQDCVEEVLMKAGYLDVAKAYIIYRDEHKKLRDATKSLLDSQDIIRKYIGQKDWRVNENANIDYSHSGLLWHGVGTVMAYYALNHVYPLEIARAHQTGDFHVHDLSMPICGYCAGWSLRQLLLEGFGGVPHKVASKPAKHLRVALGQIINFIGTLQNEWAGAQAFSSFDTYLAPFVRKDNLSYEDVKQSMQEFLHNMNVTSRWGGQSPFSNITLDLNPPEDLKDKPVIIGEAQENVYGDYQKEMDMINQAFLDTLIQGDANSRVFTWPIPTYNITRDFDWDSETSNKIFGIAAKYGIPYFSNFINSDLKPTDVRSMCCRLRLDLKELSRNFTGGLFGSGESTGSVGVVTINLPKIGYLAKDDYEYFERLDQLMYLGMRSLEIKRKVVTKNFENWLLPYSKRYLGNLDHHFSTIGLVGMNESCINFLGEDIASKQGKQFAVKVLNFMRDKIQEFQQDTGHIYNLEATPAEGTSHRLARIDKQAFADIKTAGQQKVPYYTNSTQLPVEYTDDVLTSLRHQEALQTLYTGGTVFHTFLGEALDMQGAKTMVKKMTSGFRLPYITLSPTFSICTNHGYLKGKHEACPTCNNTTEVYSRVVGYIRPVAAWNPGKQEEFKMRKLYNSQAFNNSQVPQVAISSCAA